MKKNLSAQRSHRAAFTLIELLVVISIIAILAAMILSALKSAHVAALKMKAKLEMSDIVNAINAYETDYGRLPVSANEQANAGTNDFTTGLMTSPVTGTLAPSYDNNSNVVAILMDLTAYANGDPTVNTNHVKNPKQTKYLNAKPSGYTPIPNDLNPLGGVDNTGVYRDPWGSPYIITMDTSYDDHARDALYSLQAVSQNPPIPATYTQAGYNGLSNPNTSPGSQPEKDSFLFNGKVMVWSLGPDKKFDVNPANTGFNKDNILSWQ